MSHHQTGDDTGMTPGVYTGNLSRIIISIVNICLVFLSKIYINGRAGVRAGWDADDDQYSGSQVDLIYRVFQRVVSRLNFE